MSYWPGELVQTLSISGNVLSINPGNSVVLPGGSVSSFTVVDAEVGSISSLTVSSINGVAPGALNVADWSLYPATSNVNIDGFSINNVSSINGGVANFSTINTNVLNATSTIHVISSISSSQLEVQSIVNLSTINGQPISSLGSPADWSLFPAQSTVNMNGNSLISASNILSYQGEVGTFTPSSFTRMLNVSTILGENTTVLEQQTVNSTITTTSLTTSQDSLTLSLLSQNVPVASMSASSTIGGWEFSDRSGSNYTMINGVFSTPFIQANTIFIDLTNTSSIITSSINGAEFTGAGGGSISISNVIANSVSTFSAEIRQGLFSSIVFNPTINPQFNIQVNTGFSEIGQGLLAVGAGLLSLAVSLPVAGYEFGYGLGKGMNSATEPRAINNINNNNYEVYNYASQLQLSTLGTQVSTIFRTISTIPSTITNLVGSTIATTTNIEIFTSTISSQPPFLAMRAVADPLQFISTPWSYEQMLSDDVWVEIPTGLASNASTLNVSTITFSPSTILKGDLDGSILEVLEAANGTDYGEVKAAGYWVQLSNTDPNFGIYARNSSNIPTWIDSNFTPNPFALQGKQVAFSEVDFPVKDGNQSTITNLFVNNSAEPSLTYGIYPPGFPSTIAAQIKFLSSIDGGVGGVQILSQLGQTKSLTVNGSGVLASDIITGSNSDYPLLVQVPNLDQFVLLGLSTLNGGVGKTEIINTLSTNQGQLIIAAPNSSNNGSTRIMYLDSASTCVGINQPNPSFTLDVNGNINATNNIYTNTSHAINANVSSLNVSSNLRWNETSFAAPQVFLSGGLSNAAVINTNIIASPYVDVLTFYKGFTNSDAPGGYLCMAADQGLFGINKIPGSSIDLDVNGVICASNISTPQISTSQFYASESIVSSIVANNVSTNVLNTTFGLVTNATISSITQPIQLDDVPQPGTSLAAGFNFDPFVGSRFGVFDGKQMVQGGYFLTTDASLGGGTGQATFTYPVPLSSMMTFTGTYFTNSTSPGINHPVWVGNGVPDAFGRASTIQIYGDANRDIFCQFIGFV